MNMEIINVDVRCYRKPFFIAKKQKNVSFNFESTILIESLFKKLILILYLQNFLTDFMSKK